MVHSPVDRDLAFRRVSGAAYLILVVQGPQVFDSHLVAGQRAGFVGADHRGGTQGFHAGKLLDQCIAFAHALHGHGERPGHGGQQPFEDESHHHAEEEDECFGQWIMHE